MSKIDLESNKSSGSSSEVIKGQFKDLKVG